MSAPPLELPAGQRPWYARTGLVFGALATIVVATILLTPGQEAAGSGRLTTLSRGARGAQLFADAAERLGWTVERDSSVPTRAPLRADRVYVILDPPEQLTGREYSRVFDAVRRGAGLLVVHPGGDAIDDSLGLERSNGGARMQVPGDAARDCPSGEQRFGINWAGGDVYSLWLVPKRPLPADTVHFLPVMRPLTPKELAARGLDPDDENGASTALDTTFVEADSKQPADDSARAELRAAEEALAAATNAADSAKLKRALDRVRRRQARDARVPAPAAIGLPLGRGRVVVVADPDWLRNDVVRVCRWNASVTSVRMLEWLSAGGAPRHLVVDEWHHGRGIHASAGGALGYFFVRDPRGRVITQGIVAAVLLLLALGARPLAPAGTGRIERRSPFEHVGALARAYEEIEATRVVTRRLVHGLRRRLGASSGPSSRDDDAMLAALEARHPALAPQIALVREGLAHPQTPARLLETGRAIAEIERAVVRT